MLPFSARRLRKLLRFPALALLVFAVLANPVLATVGDLHESSDGGAEHALPSGSHDHDEGGKQEQGSDLLHALAHAAHCCGHQTAIFSTSFLAHAPLFSEAAPMPAFAVPHSAPRTDLFRPPIAI